MKTYKIFMYSLPKSFGHDIIFIDLLFRKFAEMADVIYIKSDIEDKIIVYQIFSFNFPFYYIQIY